MVFIITFGMASCASPPRDLGGNLSPKTHYRSARVLGNTIFYRDAGDPEATTILLLHGYPSSSHTYRELIPMLALRYRVIAPDNLGSGYSDHPDPARYTYTFDKLADHVEALLSDIRVKEYVVYMQDFGAPVGFRLMMRHPENVIGFVSQNANAYLDGLTEKRRKFFHSAQTDQSRKQVASLFKWTSKEAVINGQYLRDVPENRRSEISPDAWTHDLNFLRTANDRKIQVQLFQDYQTNIDQYPSWQDLMRKWKFPALIVWGKNDAAFLPDGARAYLRDLPRAELHLIDAGHFAVEEKASEVAALVLRFVEDLPNVKP